MGTFDENRAAMDEAYATGMDRMGVEFDGKAPATKPAPAAPAPVQAASAPKAAEDTGPGFWSRLGSGIASVAGKTADLVEDAASRVEFRSISGARGNALVNLAPPPRPEPPWAWILGGAAAVAVLLAWMTRR